MLLVYTVFQRSSNEELPALQGMEGETISFLDDQVLVAAISTAPKNYGSPDLPELMVYAKTIETLSHSRTLLPFRYGCFLDNSEQVLELLHRRRQIFQTALDEVADCVELSLRLILSKEECTKKAKPSEAIHQSSLGAMYLATRSAYYAEKDQVKKATALKTQEIHTAFSGLYVKSLVETSGLEQGGLLTMHFLVPRENATRFLEVFRLVEGQGNNKALLTGPWPPYNFFRNQPSEMQS